MVFLGKALGRKTFSDQYKISSYSINALLTREVIRIKIIITQDLDSLTISPNLCYKKCMRTSKENLCFNFGASG